MEFSNNTSLSIAKIVPLKNALLLFVKTVNILFYTLFYIHKAYAELKKKVKFLEKKHRKWKVFLLETFRNINFDNRNSTTVQNLRKI